MMQRMFLTSAFVIAGVLGTIKLAVAQPLEIIELRNRPADQIIPIVRPMLDKDGAISGSGFQLLVRTSPGNLVQVRQMVASLDRAARQLVIQVRQDQETSDNHFDARAGGVIRPGNSRITGTITDSAAQGRSDIAQQVRTQEGSPAFIRSGTSQLVPARGVRRTVNGVVVQDTAVERDLTTGFYATPRVNGDNVTIDISTHRDTPANNLGTGGANIGRASTTISGRLGEWLEVGGTSQSRVSEGRGIVSRSSEAGSLTQRVYLRVDEVR